jgi:flagellar biosynthesis protein FliR
MLGALQHILTSLGIHAEPATFIVLFGLIFARLVSAISLAPFLGGRAVSGRIKVGLAAVTGMLLFTSVAPPANLVDMNALRMSCLLVKEAVIGATLGFLSQLIFYSVQMSGAMVDYGRGMSQATFFAPQLESNVSLLGQIQFQASLVLFVVLNGHLLFLRALAQSFRNVPLLDFPTFSGGTIAGAEQIAHYTAETLLISVQLSAPALIALFLVDISFGMLGKVASGFQVHSESQPVKAMVGLGVVLLALAYILNRMPVYFSGMLQELDRFMHRLQ